MCGGCGECLRSRLICRLGTLARTSVGRRECVPAEVALLVRMRTWASSSKIRRWASSAMRSMEWVKSAPQCVQVRAEGLWVDGL